MDVFVPMNETNSNRIDFLKHRAFVYRDRRRFSVVSKRILALLPNESVLNSMNLSISNIHIHVYHHIDAVHRYLRIVRHFSTIIAYAESAHWLIDKRYE